MSFQPREFRPAPKPGPKRKGRAYRRNPNISEATKARDGYCLYGLVVKDGCSDGLDPAHIRGWGGTGIDTLENMISLCRKHHNQHENGDIADLTLQLILYRFYGYGPDEWLFEILEAIKDYAERMGYTIQFDSENGDSIDCHIVGTGTATMFTLTMSFLESVCLDMVLTMAYDYITAVKYAPTAQ